MKIETLKLKDVCNLITCGVAKRPNYTDSGIPFLSSRNVKKQKIVWNNFRFISLKAHKELTKYNKPSLGDILYTRVGSYGEAAIINKDIEFSIFVSLTLIKPKKNIINNKYLVYFLNSPIGKQLAKNGVNSSGVGNLNVSVVREFEIPVPSLSKQQSIVDEIDSLFINTNKLIDFDEQKLLKINLFKDSVLRNAFNVSSKKIKLKDEVEYDKENALGRNLPYIGMENISKNTMEVIGEINILKKKSSTFVFNNSHVLFGRLRPYLKKVLTPSFDGQCSTEIFCLKPSKNIDRNFLAYWLLSPDILYKINSSYTGTRMPRANMKALLDYQFPIISIPEQKETVIRINKAFALLNKLKITTQKKISNYKSLQASILNKKLKNKIA